MKYRIKSLDGLRGWASFAVLLSHAWVCFLMWALPEYALTDEKVNNFFELNNIYGIFF
jgi:peptidoglycan/LPS O-acetylase OafA/YrhL